MKKAWRLWSRGGRGRGVGKLEVLERRKEKKGGEKSEGGVRLYTCIPDNVAPTPALLCHTAASNSASIMPHYSYTSRGLCKRVQIYPGVLQGRDPVTNSGRLEGMMVAGVAGVAELRGGLLLTS